MVTILPARNSSSQGQWSTKPWAVPIDPPDEIPPERLVRDCDDPADRLTRRHKAVPHPSLDSLIPTKQNHALEVVHQDGARDQVELEVLRPPTLERLAQLLEEAQSAGSRGDGRWSFRATPLIQGVSGRRSPTAPPDRSSPWTSRTATGMSPHRGSPVITDYRARDCLC